MAASSRAVAVALAALAVLSAARAPRAVDTPVSREADAFHAKLLRIAARGERRPVARAALAPQTTTITERELNAYLRYRARDQIPVGITDPYIWIVGDGRLAGTGLLAASLAIGLMGRGTWTGVRRLRWYRREKGLLAVVFGSIVVLIGTLALAPEQLSYSTYPWLRWPPFQPVIGLAYLSLAAPALWLSGGRS